MLAFIRKKFNFRDEFAEIQNEQKMDWETPLLSKVFNQNYKSTEMLLSNGANPNESVPGKLTPLALAIKNNDLETTRTLLRYGADPNSREFYQPTSDQIDNWIKNKFELKNGLELTQVKDAYYKDGLDLENPNFWNNRVINIAIDTGNMDIVKLLIQHGADLNRQNDDHFIPTPIKKAVNKNRLDIAELLIKNGADVELIGGSLLQKSILYNNPDMVNVLIENGAKAFYRDDAGKSLLSESLKIGNPKIFETIFSQIILEKELYKEMTEKQLKKVRGLERKISRETSESKIKSLKKNLKRSTVEMYEYTDRVEKITTIIDQAIIYGIMRSKPYECIIKLIAEKNDIDLTHTSPDELKSIYAQTVQDIKENKRSKSLFKDPARMIINDRQHTLLQLEKLNPNKKYSPCEILKASTYLQNKSTDSERVHNLYNKLDNYNDPYISLVNTTIALASLENYQDNKPARIIVSKSESGSITSLLQDEDGTGITLGISCMPNNEIMFSRILRESESTRTFLHEMTHVACALVREDSDRKDVKNLNTELNKKISDLKLLINEGLHDPEIKDKRPYRYIKEQLKRVEDNSDEYNYDAYANEDVLCDIVACRQYAHRHPDRKDAMIKLTEPLMEHIDKYLLPKLASFILNHDKLKMVRVPVALKEKLISINPRKCEEKGITISPLGMRMENRSPISKREFTP